MEGKCQILLKMAMELKFIEHLFYADTLFYIHCHII